MKALRFAQKANQQSPLNVCFSVGTGVWPIFQAVFGNLTGGDARPTLWRGRPRPRWPALQRRHLRAKRDLPALRDGADLESSVTGAEAEAPAYYHGVPPDFAKASSG